MGELWAVGGRGLGLPPRSFPLLGVASGGQLDGLRDSDLVLLKLVVVEAGALSLIEGFLRRVEVVVLKRRRQLRSRLG